MDTLFPIVYAGTIEYYRQVKKASAVIMDKHEHFVKQTYRSRCTIYAANGKLDLIIPVEKGKSGHQAMGEVKISYDHNWQRLHWKSLESAYRCSPYFEFYEHHFSPFYEDKIHFLADFNLKMHELICSLLEIDTQPALSEKYLAKGVTIMRYLADPVMQQKITVEPYTQVFETKHGFIGNLSIFDLLFNCGPHSPQYL